MRQQPGMVLGHKLDFVWGKYRRNNRPELKTAKVPLHPNKDEVQNMNEIVQYADLKIRWRHALHPARGKMKLARKWMSAKNHAPHAEPTAAFLWHKHMPHREALPDKPPPIKFDPSEAFAIFKSSVKNQHKVTVGDIVQAEKIHRREAGEQVTFATVLMVGNKDFTCFGKPTIPYARVKCTIEQQTLSGDQLVFKYKPRRRVQNFHRHRQWVTMLRVDDIILDPSMPEEEEPKPPLRLLDIWANRWLDPEELQGIEMKEDGRTPVAADIHDGSEYTRGGYHRRGLTESYRFFPDPKHTHWMK